jgi:3',5'-nucleoside bisphosphate phosphatase
METVSDDKQRGGSCVIDLHVHSTFSDGSLTPEQLAEQAKIAGLTGIALTDHDTTDGTGLFVSACASRNIKGIVGVEISVDFQPGTMHLLGYLIDTNHVGLQDALRRVRLAREDRNARILEKLNALGLPLTMPEVEKFAGEDVVGRPHFAQALLAQGRVANTREAFDRYLAKGKPAYCDRFRLSAEESIPLIHAAGGVASMSHPFTLQLSNADLKQYVAKLAGIGLDGIEVFYSEHSKGQEREYLSLVQEFNLIATGGSDFHGKLNPQIRLGVGFGSLQVQDEIMDGLLRAQAARAKS